MRSASNVDELMSLIYPSYWAALKCRSKLSAASTASKLQLRRLRPLADTEEPTFAAAYLNLDLLKSMFSLCFDICFTDLVITAGKVLLSRALHRINSQRVAFEILKFADKNVCVCIS